MKQVFAREPVSLNSSFLLDEKQAHHIFDVLRSKPKETIRVIRDNEVFLAHPEEKPYLYIFGKEEAAPRACDITLCASLIKQDKWEWMLQKAAELGVSRIVPFTCRNSIIHIDERKADRKLERWSSILEAAAKQSNRPDYVMLEPITRFEDLPAYKSKCNLVAYEKEDGSHHISNYLNSHPDSVTVVIGPEGGFEVSEIDFLVEHGFIPCSLGSLILRAETASLYALMAVEYSSHLDCEEEDA